MKVWVETNAGKNKQASQGPFGQEELKPPFTPPAPAGLTSLETSRPNLTEETPAFINPRLARRNGSANRHREGAGLTMSPQILESVVPGPGPGCEFLVRIWTPRADGGCTCPLTSCSSIL